MSMREKIARAIDPKAFSFSELIYRKMGHKFDPENDMTQSAFDKADAVLEALMEPDWEMMQSGADASPMWDTRSSAVYAIAVNDVADIFRAMIQAAREGE